MEIRESVREGCNIIQLMGYLHRSEHSNLAELPAVQDRTNKIILDLRGIEFIDSMGLQLIVRIHLACMKNSGMLVLAGPQPPIMDLFKLVELNSIVEIVDTVDQAVTMLKGPITETFAVPPIHTQSHQPE